MKVRQVAEALRMRPTSNRVSVIDFYGEVGSDFNLETSRDAIVGAFSDRRAEVVILNINSPGGSPTQTYSLARFIDLTAKRTQKRVVSIVQDYAASGGYWLACVAPSIFITPCSTVGSIGVITETFGFADTIKRLGIERRVFTVGSCKSFFDPFKPIEECSLESLKESMNEVYGVFVDRVKSSRADRIKKKDFETLFSGRPFTGQEAVKVGLADGMMTLDEFVQSEFGHETQLVRYETYVGNSH